MAASQADPLYTTEEVAELLHTSPSAIRVQSHRGTEPGSLGVLIGRRLFFRVADIDEFIDRKFAEARRDRVLA